MVISKLTPNIVRIKSKPFGPNNPIISNSYLIGRSRDRILIDYGSGHPEAIDALKQYLRKEDAEISFVLATSNRTKPAAIDIRLKSLLHNQSVQIGNCLIKALCTKGYSDTHMSYYFPNEDVMFTGCSVLSRPSSKCKSQYSNLADFKASLKLQYDLFPKLLLGLHGDVEVGVSQIQNVQQELNQIDAYLLDCINSGTITTLELITKYANQHSISDLFDMQVLSGNIRAHLIHLESSKLAKRVDVLFKESSMDGLETDLKGPGGLTMEQIYGEIQKSRKLDFKANLSSKQKDNTQAIINDRTSWRIF